MRVGILTKLAQRKNKNIAFRVDPGFFAWIGASDRDEMKKIILENTAGSIHPISIERWAWQEKKRGDFKPSSSFDDALVWAKNNNVYLHYYHLIWWHHSIQYNPDWLFPNNTDCSRYNKAELKNITNTHIKTVIQYMQNKSNNHVKAWNVVNEAFMGNEGDFTPSCYYKVMGTDYIFEAFKTARYYDPDGYLVLNVSFGRVEPRGEKATKILNFVREMKERDVPIDAIGVQNHIAMSAIDNNYFENWRLFLNNAKAIGVKVVITEFDILDDTPLVTIKGQKYTQADLYAQTVKMCLDDPTCAGVNFWGISDKYSWFRNKYPTSHPLLFDDNMNPKEGYYKIKAVLEE